MPSAGTGEAELNRAKLWQWGRVLLAVLVVAAIFFAIIPRIATYSAVWRTLSSLTVPQLGFVIGVALVNIFTYWLQSVAAMPGLTLPQAAVVTQTTTTIANTLPGGGAVAVGVGFALFRSWGFTESQVALYTLVTGVWNVFIKLGLPVVALALLALEGGTTTSLATASVVGVLTLVGAIVLFALALSRESHARAIGHVLERVATAVLRPFRRPPVKGIPDRAVRFRRETIELVRRRWAALTLATVVSHLSLYLVLLVCLRVLGVSQSEVSWIEALGVFAFGRLVTALPITPGGLGVVELTYIGGLVAAGGDRTDVVAAVLLFRGLTYALQIPLGAVAYPFAARVGRDADRRRRPRRASLAEG
jgi:putative heme transporter